MEQFVKVLKRLFILPGWLTIFISIPSFGLVIYTLILGEQNLLAYLSYFLSAYALCISGTFTFRVVQFFRKTDIKSELESRIKNEKAIHFLEDQDYRTRITLHMGVWINLAYIVMKLYYGMKFKSYWFIGLAGYYFFVTWMKGVLLQYFRQNKPEERSRVLELKKMRKCGVVLLFLHMALAGIVFLMVYNNHSMDYPGVLIYVMAAYTFYALGMAIYNLIKYRKSESPVMISIKILGFATALVSMLSLETAMIATFGAEESDYFRWIMVSLTGAAVCIIVLSMAVYMLVYTANEKKKWIE